MTFPIDPDRYDDLDQFLIQDPFNLRKQVLPILTIDRNSGFLTGLGTAFRAGPFGTFLTAEHVLNDHFVTPEAGDSAIAAVLFGIGLVYGTVGLSSKYFAPIREAMCWRSATDEPPVLIGAPQPPRMVADVMRFHVDASAVPGPQAAPPLPIRLSGRRPEVGDRVMAIGYPELTCLQHEEPDKAMRFTERMYGAVGRVTSLLPQGRGTSRPWPMIEIEAHWRSGMSGGPVFNEQGEVIGLVSFSLEPDGELPGVGYATDFAGVQLHHLVPGIDPSNPGWALGWGVVRREPWHLAGLFPDQEQAETFRRELGEGYEVRFGSRRLGSDDFLS